jgi:hypothetical protein
MFDGLFNRVQMALWRRRCAKMLARVPGHDDPDTANFAAHDFSRMNNWQIVCEEVLDTQYPKIYHQHAQAELARRGIGQSEFREMRRVAWQTAGWLNYEKMLWDWCQLDAKDMLRAVEWQLKESYISHAQAAELRSVIQKYEPKR